MKPQKHFKKHYAKLRFEAWFFSILSGLITGFGCGFITALITWFTKLNGLLLALIVIAGVTLITAPIFYFTKFRLTAMKNARRLDSLGLEERLVTMVEFENEESVIAHLQREDAKAHLAKLKTSSLKLKIKPAMLASFIVTFVLVSAMLTVTILSQAGIIPSGDELLEDAIEEAQEVYFSVTYEVEDGGYIEGEADQLVLQGSNALPVVAVAEEGYVFVEWDDGRSKPGREDTEITDHVIYIAVFELLIEEGDEGSDDSDESPNDSPNESENASQSRPGEDSDSPSSAGGKYEEANQIIDGETYYREVLESYKELLRERLEKEGDQLTEEERAIIEAYLGIV
ncbi:MAG: hypothetical protein E7645_02240 [Ruminococcaceae bacterium]|nr:hypothetical protein [Oscillospiraceae bacterium]